MRTGILFVALLAITVTASNGAYAKPILIVSAEASGEVVFVDPVKAQSVERVRVGARPRGIKLSHDGRRLLVALAGPPKPATRAGAAPAPLPAGDGSAGLAVIDVAARKVTKQVTTPASPFAVDFLPDGRTAYVSNSDTSEVLVIDVAAGSVKKKIPVGMEPRGVGVRPDGKVVYIATHGADEISAIDTKTMSLLGRIDAGSRPQTIVFAPRREAAFVVDEGAPIVTTLDTKRNMFKEQFVIQGLAKTTPPPALQSAVISPDGKHLYVTTGPGRSVLIVELAKKAAVGTIDGVGAFPRGIAIRPDGKKLYVANGASNDVAIIDIASKKVEARVAVPGAPWGIVLAP
jgi:YVTN family beta-propeller protein